jgi:competence protein ComEA
VALTVIGVLAVVVAAACLTLVPELAGETAGDVGDGDASSQPRVGDADAPGDGRMDVVLDGLPGEADEAVEGSGDAAGVVGSPAEGDVSGGGVSAADAAFGADAAPGAVGSGTVGAAPGAAGSAGLGDRIVVHVAGAVIAAGVVELPAGARVHEAVSAAGGARSDADLAAVNLARLLVDGERVYIPVPGETPPPADEGPVGGVGAPETSGSASASGSGAGLQAGLVDLNAADAAALMDLPGIGPVLAERIVTYRTSHGPFPDVESLADVSGIGPAILDAVRDLVTVG